MKNKLNSFLLTPCSRNNNLRNSSKTINTIFKKRKISSDLDILNDFTLNKKIKKPTIYLLDNTNDELKNDEMKLK